MIARMILLRRKSLYRWGCLFFLIALFLAGCSGASTVPTQRVPGVEPPIGSTELDGPPTPNLTPQPIEVVIISGEESSTSLIEEVHAFAAGRDYIVSSATTLNEVPQTASLAMVMPGSMETEGLITAVSIPTIFIKPTDIELRPENNYIDLEPAQGDELGFLTGFIGALLTSPDWRAATIYSPSNPESANTLTGFNNGVPYYCGLCRPFNPPQLLYPVTIAVQDPTNQAELDLVRSALVENQIDLVFIQGSTVRDALVPVVDELEILVVSDASPVDPIADLWVATVETDLQTALASMFDDVLAGGQGIQRSARLQLTQINELHLSIGKQREVLAVIQDLDGGFIQTGVNP